MTTALRELTRELGIRPMELIAFNRRPRELILDPFNPRISRDQAVLAEAEFVAKRAGIPLHRLAKDLGLLWPIAGGSFQRGTSQEVLYSSFTTGTQLNTFTTEANLQATIPNIIVPAGFWFDASDVGKSLKLHAKGRLGTTGAPTFTWTWRLLTSTTWSAAGVSMSSAALTAGTTQTLAPWYLDIDIAATAMVQGATGLTLQVHGLVTSPLGLASPFAGTIPGNNTAFTVTLDPTSTQYMYLSAACGTSNAANLIQVEMIKVYGEN